MGKLIHINAPDEVGEAMKHVLFVCTGNTCRSPLAEQLLMHKLKGEWEVKSAGVAAFPGNGASNHVVTLLKERNIEISHKAQLVTPALMEWADIVLTMTSAHQAMLQEAFPEHAEKIDTLKHYVIGVNADVRDPFGGSEAEYRETLEELDELLEQWIDKEKN